MSLSRKSGPTVGLQDVADAAGVSAMTVSRALRGIEGVSESKRREIEKVAKKLNYFPNNNARALVATNSDLVGISFPTLFNDVFADVFDGMRRTFEHAGLATVVDTTSYRPEVELEWVDRVMSWHPAAIVLTGNDHHKDVSTKLRKAGIPTLELWDVCDDPIDICVGIDHFRAGVEIGEYTVSLGYRRPGFVGVTEGLDPRADKRRFGIEHAFAQSGRSAAMAVSLQESQNAFLAGEAGLYDLMSRADPPDVIFFVNDHLAFGGLAACESSGIAVPETVGLVGFNALDLTSVLPKKLATVKTPRHEMGVIGARNLISRIKGVKPERCVTLSVDIINGKSTRKQRKMDNC